MSTIEENIVPAAAASGRTSGDRWFARLVRFACSVRLGVTLLCLLGLACLIGMLVMQQNVDGFENYYAALTPSQRVVYGKLGLFNIYHVWYFNALLALLSLNIILASIDRFPKTWKFASKPQITVPLRWLTDQKLSATLYGESGSDTSSAEIVDRLKAHGWRSVRHAEKNGTAYIFAESGVWNRFGAYAVHVALLTIFLGGFLTAQLGTTGDLPLAPGESSDLMRETVVDLDRVSEVTKKLPFEITFTDIEQKLIKDDGPITAGNTLDWITRFTITDEDGMHEAMVQMNRPFDYRGYRFFQASFTPLGRARSIVLDVIPAGGVEAERLEIGRDGVAILPDGTRIRFDEFRGNFRIGPEDPNEDTTTYPNPAAVLQVVPPGGTVQTAYAFGPEMADIPAARKPVAGYTYRLAGFEKVADRHVLSVQRDPGSTVVYVGFTGLFLTLLAVFLFSHQRVWVAVERLGDGRSRIVVAGNTNRNPNPFEEKFSRFVKDLRSDSVKVEVI